MVVTTPASTPAHAIVLRGVDRRFGSVQALRGVSLAVARGEIHALLGANGAGKTTLLRILTGLAEPDCGHVELLGEPASREHIGFVPAGDRTFYLRLSGEENLVFFARLNGLGRRAARARAREVLQQVDLADAAGRRVHTYSHGMQKRLSLARALLTEPPALLVDEATHDLDPEASTRVRDLVAELARRGTAVVWATQRIEEIRGFADRVTVLAGGEVRFAGPVGALLARADGACFVLKVSGCDGTAIPPLATLRAALRGCARVTAAADRDHVHVELAPGATVGDAVNALTGAGARVHDCRRERPEVEDAFLAVAGRAAA